jgi:predicted ABC-type ATPase
LFPEIVVFAGPNGSGKSTITKMSRTVGTYINADNIKAATYCTDMEAALEAEHMRESALAALEDFTFETVLSTRRNLDLLKRAKEAGYFLRCIYVLTSDPEINAYRVQARQNNGGHGVPLDKIISRYYKALDLIPELVELCDIVHIYDNSSTTPFRIFKKRKTCYFAAENDIWTLDKIATLTGVNHLEPFPAKS